MRPPVVISIRKALASSRACCTPAEPPVLPVPAPEQLGQIVTPRAVGETLILLEPILFLAGVSIAMERVRQQNDRTLVNG